MSSGANPGNRRGAGAQGQRKYASGKFALAHCDRCGQRYKLLDLRMEWTGLKVCQTCWEPMHPQLTPRPKSDSQALRDPRPDRDQDELDGQAPGSIDDLFPPTFGGGS